MSKGVRVVEGVRVRVRVLVATHLHVALDVVGLEHLLHPLVLLLEVLEHALDDLWAGAWATGQGR